MDPFESYADLRAQVTEVAATSEVIGYATGGAPVLAARNGGTKSPSIMVTTGAHATEHAGVVATVRLLDELDTDHEVVVVPSRDPVGVSGFAHALELGIGEPVTIESYGDLAERLRSHGHVVVDQDDLVIALIGDYVYATAPPTADTAGTKRVKDRLEDLQETDAWAKLHGRRLFLVPGQPQVEGTGDFGRLYTLVISPSGEELHLNRYLGNSWGPPESRAVTELFSQVDPGLFVDVHEYLGDGNWVSIRPQQTPTERAQAEAIGRRMLRSLDEAGRRLTPLSEFLPDAEFFAELEPGLFDLDYETRGEGYNATDYAAEFHGLAFTHETGMKNPFGDRVEAAVTSVKTAVQAFADDVDRQVSGDP